MKIIYKDILFKNLYDLIDKTLSSCNRAGVYKYANIILTKERLDREPIVRLLDSPRLLNYLNKYNFEENFKLLNKDSYSINKTIVDKEIQDNADDFTKQVNDFCLMHNLNKFLVFNAIDTYKLKTINEVRKFYKK